MSTKEKKTIIPIVLLILYLLLPVTTGFRSLVSQSTRCCPIDRQFGIKSILKPRTKSTTTTLLYMGLFGNNNKKNTENNNNNNNAPAVDNDTKVETVIKIDAKSIKIGALRFLMNVHLVGEQNNPEPQSWKCRQTDNENNIRAYYCDGSAMLEVVVSDTTIIFQRYSYPKPSLQYMLHESVLIHNILDELEFVAYGIPEDIQTEFSDNQRLLQLEDNTVLEKARALLPVRREK